MTARATLDWLLEMVDSGNCWPWYRPTATIIYRKI